MRGKRLWRLGKLCCFQCTNSKPQLCPHYCNEGCLCKISGEELECFPYPFIKGSFHPKITQKFLDSLIRCCRSYWVVPAHAHESGHAVTTQSSAWASRWAAGSAFMSVYVCWVFSCSMMFYVPLASARISCRTKVSPNDISLPIHWIHWIHCHTSCIPHLRRENRVRIALIQPRSTHPTVRMTRPCPSPCQHVPELQRFNSLSITTELVTRVTRYFLYPSPCLSLHESPRSQALASWMSPPHTRLGPKKHKRPSNGSTE